MLVNPWLKPKCITVEAECPECQATGIWGTIEGQEHIARICDRCKGKGVIIISYIPFAGRKKRKKITHVKIGRGYLKYDEFLYWTRRGKKL